MSQYQQVYPKRLLYTLMTDAKKLPTYQEQHRTLSNLQLLDPKIFPDHVLSFIEYQHQLSKKYARSKDLPNNFFIQKLQIITALLKQAHPDVSFMYVLKKCAFLHLVLHHASKQGTLDAKLASLGHEIATEIVNELIPVVGDMRSTATKKQTVKRESSLTRVYNAVRSLSVSTPRSSKSKISIEQGQQKGAIREVMTKIMTPFASYLLKISQDYEVYSQILTRRVDLAQMEVLKWKICNYLLQLSKITVEFNRLGKYYQTDMKGPWILLNYILSTDIAIYYDLVITDLQRRCQQWKQSIAVALKMTKLNKKNKSSLSALLAQPQLLELKEQICLVTEIKQNLFFLYYNIQTQKYSYIMTPPFAAGEKNIKMGPIQFIMDVYENARINDSAKEKIKKESYADHSRISFNTPRKGDLLRSVKIESSQQKPKMFKANSEQKVEKQEETAKTVSTFNPSARNPVRGNSFIQNIKQRTMGL